MSDFIDETDIALDGKLYGFKVDQNGEITYIPPQQEKIYSYPDALSGQPIEIPKMWLIISKRNHMPLFALRPNETDSQKFRIITSQDLYDHDKAQWFEPLADNYREMLWVHPQTYIEGSPQYNAYKHFSWNEIIEFSVEDRLSIAYKKKYWADWKIIEKGGAESLMVAVDQKLYWTDAIGQIPFAVDTTRLFLDEFSGDKDRAVLETIKKGIKHGDGGLFFPKPDNDNSYDNYMVLRGALWAIENFRYSEQFNINKDGNSVEKSIEYIKNSDSKLRNSITNDLLNKYGLWEH